MLAAYVLGGVLGYGSSLIGAATSFRPYFLLGSRPADLEPGDLGDRGSRRQPDHPAVRRCLAGEIFQRPDNGTSASGPVGSPAEVSA